MAHRFRLDFLLRLYAALERRQELTFAAVAGELAVAREQLEAQARRCHEHKEQMSGALTEGVPGAELRFHLLVLERAEGVRVRCAQAVAEVTVRYTGERERLLEARRRRESLELLRRRENDAATLEAGRREQAKLDELFLMRRERDRD